jgi:hypothetical protein
MARFRFGIVLASALSLVPTIAAAALPGKLDVRGDDVAFYPFANQTVVLAKGHVKIAVGRRTISGDAAYLDLTKNRLVVSGDVTVSGGVSVLAGTAYALELASDDATLLRIAPTPQTLLLHGDDVQHAKVADAPAGTFDANDLEGVRPLMRSKHAAIATNANVRMTPAQVALATGAMVAVPSYLYTFGYNPNLAQQAAPSATIDQLYPLFGTANSLATAHLRYTSNDGVEPAIEENLVNGRKAFLATSILPFRGRRFDIYGYQSLGSNVQQTFQGYHLFGTYPIDYGRYSLQWTTRSSSVAYYAQQINTTHQEDVSVSSIEHTISRLIAYRATLDYGYDRTPTAFYNPTDFHYGASAYAYVPTLTLPLGLTFQPRYSYGISKYDYPRVVTSENASVTVSRRNAVRHLDLTANASIDQENDMYRTGIAQYLSLPDPTLPYYAPDGTLYPGFFAYTGLNTYRTYSLEGRYSPKGETYYDLRLTRTDDFPQYHGYGRPPNQADFYFHTRIFPQLAVDLSRSYTFGWNGQYLSPQYGFSLSP